MVMEFQIKADNTFACYEKAPGVEANYTGVWDVVGDRVGLYQEVRDGRKEEDELVGTIAGDRMDLVHRQQGMSLNIVLVR